MPSTETPSPLNSILANITTKKSPSKELKSKSNSCPKTFNNTKDKALKTKILTSQWNSLRVLRKRVWLTCPEYSKEGFRKCRIVSICNSLDSPNKKNKSWNNNKSSTRSSWARKPASPSQIRKTSWVPTIACHKTNTGSPLRSIDPWLWWTLPIDIILINRCSQLITSRTNQVANPIWLEDTPKLIVCKLPSFWITTRALNITFQTQEVASMMQIKTKRIYKMPLTKVII